MSCVYAAILAYSRDTKFYYAYYVVKTLAAIAGEGSFHCLALAYVVLHSLINLIPIHFAANYCSIDSKKLTCALILIYLLGRQSSSWEKSISIWNSCWCWISIFCWWNISGQISIHTFDISGYIVKSNLLPIYMLTMFQVGVVNGHAHTAKVRKKRGGTDIIEGADLKSWSVLEKK